VALIELHGFNGLSYEPGRPINMENPRQKERMNSTEEGMGMQRN
jgi:hypothetical protein